MSSDSKNQSATFVQDAGNASSSASFLLNTGILYALCIYAFSAMKGMNVFQDLVLILATVGVNAAIYYYSLAQGASCNYRQMVTKDRENPAPGRDNSKKKDVERKVLFSKLAGLQSLLFQNILFLVLFVILAFGLLARLPRE